jgi:solute carrier family 25 (mitochondrial folate transporter), member 32
LFLVLPSTPLHTSAATTITYPLQLMKTRMQQRMYTMNIYDDYSSIRMVQRSTDAYRSMTSTIQKIYQQEGIAGFFKGCATNAVRVAPGAAITFVVYEEVSDWLK